MSQRLVWRACLPHPEKAGGLARGELTPTREKALVAPPLHTPIHSALWEAAVLGLGEVTERTPRWFGAQASPYFTSTVERTPPTFSTGANHGNRSRPLDLHWAPPSLPPPLPRSSAPETQMGPVDGPAVLLVHGFGASHYQVGVKGAADWTACLPA